MKFLSIIVEDIWAKRLGLFSLLIPVARMHLGIHVLSGIPWEWQSLIGLTIALIWLYGMSRPDRERYHVPVNSLLVVWAFLLTFFTNSLF